ncbi:MAG: hypothetical protein HQ582_10575 [Planctomycetes bacterium]|nr:hypothetical protein [Planctomycetota bacterium]
MLIKIKKSLILGALVIVPAIGCRGHHHHGSNWATQMASNTTYAAPEPTSSDTVAAADEWVCPMHRSVRLSDRGKCSICGMELVRLGDLSREEESASGSGCPHCG